MKSSQFERLRKEFIVSNKKTLSTTEQKVTADKSSLLAAKIETQVKGTVLPTPSNKDLTDNYSMDVENAKDSNLVPEANPGIAKNIESAVLNAGEKISGKEAINKDNHKDDLISEQVETTHTSVVNLVPEANSISQKDKESAVLHAGEKISADEPEKEAINKDNLKDDLLSKQVETTNNSRVSIADPKEAIVTNVIVTPDQTVVSEPSITSEPEHKEQVKEALTVTESEINTAQTSVFQEQSKYPCVGLTTSETSIPEDLSDDKTGANEPDTITETNTELLDWFLQQ